MPFASMYSQDSFPFPDTRNVGTPEGVMSSMTPMMHGLGGNELMNLLAQQEPKVADSGTYLCDYISPSAFYSIRGGFS